MKACIFILCFFLSSFALNWEDLKMYIAGGTFSSGTIPIAGSYMDKNYKGFLGGSVTAGVGYRMQELPMIGYLGITYDRDYFLLKENTKIRLPVNTIQGTWYFGRYFYQGFSVGGAFVQLDNDTYAQLGNDTRTELQEKNKQSTLSTEPFFGIQVPVTSWAQIQYRSSFHSAEKVWMAWHSLLSGSIQGASVQIFYAMGANATLNGNQPMGIMAYVLGMGLQVAWTFIEYNQHNWPFNDPKPLRYNKQSLGIMFNFGKGWAG